MVQTQKAQTLDAEITDEIRQKLHKEKGLIIVDELPVVRDEGVPSVIIPVHVFPRTDMPYRGFSKEIVFVDKASVIPWYEPNKTYLWCEKSLCK